MSSSVWKNVNGDWGNAADWTGGIPNGSAAYATITGASAFAVTIASTEAFTIAGVTFADAQATLDLAGTLHVGHTFKLGAGTLDLTGTLAGGTLAMSGGTFESTGGTLNGVTVTGTLGVSGNVLRSEGNLAGSGSLVLSNASRLYARGGESITLASIVLGNSNLFLDAGSPALTLGAGVKLSGNYVAADPGSRSRVNISGGYTLLSHGTISATGTAGYLGIIGGDFSNGGLLSASGGGVLVLDSATFANSGTITVQSGTVTVDGAVTGTGTAAIGATGTLRFDGAVSAGQKVSFAGTTGGVLQLNDLVGNTLAFAGTVSGDSGADEVDLTGFAISGGHTLTWAQNGTIGTLTYIEGAEVARITLFGQFMTAGFHTADDGHGGTDISYTAPAVTPILAGSHH
jgi:hypothetical protein